MLAKLFVEALGPFLIVIGAFFVGSTILFADFTMASDVSGVAMTILRFLFRTSFPFASALRSLRKSIFSSDYVHGESYHHGDAIMCTSRKYLHINGIGVTNTMYGDGYITVSCTDVFTNRVTLYLCPWNLGYLQYRESSADEFNSVAALFNDDRDEIPFEVRRMLTMEEMEERRIKAKRKRIKVESVWETVMARDSSEAMKKVENAIEVRTPGK